MRLLLSLALVALMVFPAPIKAQWTQGAPGKVWVKSALFLQKTNKRFTEIGRREPYFTNGEADSRAVFTELIVGLHPQLDLWVQVPFFDLIFTDDIQRLTTAGVGDVRAWLRWNPIKLNGGATPISFRVGAKAPIAESPIDAQLIPIGEGQWDFEGFAEVGHSFWPAPVYSILWLGYRIRTENKKKFTKPGNELVFLAETGVNPTPWSLIKTTLDGFRGERIKTDRILTSSRRMITTLQFTGAVRAGIVWPEFSVRVPIAGQEFPAGLQYVIGASAQLR